MSDSDKIPTESHIDVKWLGETCSGTDTCLIQERGGSLSPHCTTQQAESASRGLRNQVSAHDRPQTEPTHDHRLAIAHESGNTCSGTWWLDSDTLRTCAQDLIYAWLRHTIQLHHRMTQQTDSASQWRTQLHSYALFRQDPHNWVASENMLRCC